MKKVIEQPGIVNLNIEVFIDDDLDITLSQSNSFTHDEIRIIKSKSREVALAICPDLEREKEEFAVGFAIWFEDNIFIDNFDCIDDKQYGVINQNEYDPKNTQRYNSSEIIELYKKDNGK